MPPRKPDFRLERNALERGAFFVCGVDEVGRGPLAGPVVAAAVRLDPSDIPPGLDDSKRLGPDRRARLAARLHDCADVALAEASVAEIDRMNILQAAMLAMERAVAGLKRPPDHILVDGNRLPEGLRERAQAVVRGDARALSIAAASVVAKVWRDRLMVDLAQHYPGYGWERNAGYPTREHLQALRDLGITPHHRRSFRPVHNILYQEKITTR